MSLSLPLSRSSIVVAIIRRDRASFWLQLQEENREISSRERGEKLKQQHDCIVVEGDGLDSGVDGIVMIIYTTTT
jgi:predicted CoA-binding protein